MFQPDFSFLNQPLKATELPDPTSQEFLDFQQLLEDGGFTGVDQTLSIMGVPLNFDNVLANLDFSNSNFRNLTPPQQQVGPAVGDTFNPVGSQNPAFNQGQFDINQLFSQLDPEQIALNVRGKI